MKMIISEKSLELNICGNIINVLRKNLNFRKVFLYGYTLRAEHRTGLDVSINLPNNKLFLLGLQFKKPIKKYGNYTYVFPINNNSKRDQHIMLFISSLIFDDIYYSFPAFIDTVELSNYSPNFLLRTFFIHIKDFPPHTFDRQQHTVIIDIKRGTAVVHSEEYEISKVYKFEDIYERLRVKAEKRELLSVEHLKDKKLSKNYIREKLREYDFPTEIVDRILEVIDSRTQYTFRNGFWI